MYDKSTRSFIDMFSLNGEKYEHSLYYMDDDRVECTDSRGKVVLMYTANSYVYDADKKMLGTFHMTSEHSWYFRPVGGGEKIVFDNHSILKAEVELSKRYIKGELKCLATQF